MNEDRTNQQSVDARQALEEVQQRAEHHVASGSSSARLIGDGRGLILLVRALYTRERDESQLAHQTALPESMVRALLLALFEIGVVSPDPRDPEWSPVWRLTSLGMWVSTVSYARAAAFLGEARAAAASKSLGHPAEETRLFDPNCVTSAGRLLRRHRPLTLERSDAYDVHSERSSNHES